MTEAIVKKISHKKTKKKDETKLNNMMKKFNPENGILFTKSYSTSSDITSIEYKIKGDQDIINYVETNFYDSLSLLTKYRFIPYKTDTGEYFNMLADERNGNLNQEFSEFITEYPIITLSQLMDNVLTIDIKLNSKKLSVHDIIAIGNIEYIIKNISDRHSEIKILTDNIKKTIFSNDIMNLDPLLFDKYQTIMMAKSDEDSFYSEEFEDDGILS
jgi:hypothetical protein